MDKYLNTKKQNISKTVIVLNDSLNAKRIAEKYLLNYKLVDNARLNLVYSGYYKNKLVTIMSSGIGMASMGIYAGELYEQYDVENIINIGFCDSYYEKINIGDIILVEKSFTTSNYAYQYCREFQSITKSSSYLNSKIINKALEKDISIRLGNIHSTDINKNTNFIKEIKENHCLGKDMETYSLLFLSNQYNKDATSILVVANNLVTNKELEDKQQTFDKVLLLILESI